MIYKTLHTAIKSILDGAETIKQVIGYPTASLNKYPAVVFFPSGVSNVFSTTAENFREYKFKMFVVAGVDQTTMKKVFEDVMSKACDDVLAEFDENWSLNSIDGKRTWIRIDSGNWGVEKTDKGLLATAEFEIIIKLSVDI